MGDLLGSSNAYDPSSFFRIRYTTNMTQRMAQSSPTTAPPTTAETKRKKLFDNSKLDSFIMYNFFYQMVMKNVKYVPGWVAGSVKNVDFRGGLNDG